MEDIRNPFSIPVCKKSFSLFPTAIPVAPEVISFTWGSPLNAGVRQNDKLAFSSLFPTHQRFLSKTLPYRTHEAMEM
jgi:hypothetical protein